LQDLHFVDAKYFVSFVQVHHSCQVHRAKYTGPKSSSPSCCKRSDSFISELPSPSSPSTSPSPSPLAGSSLRRCQVLRACQVHHCRHVHRAKYTAPKSSVSQLLWKVRFPSVQTWLTWSRCTGCERVLSGRRIGMSKYVIFKYMRWIQFGWLIFTFLCIAINLGAADITSICSTLPSNSRIMGIFFVANMIFFNQIFPYNFNLVDQFQIQLIRSTTYTQCKNVAQH
jgi:hypothetical protein